MATSKKEEANYEPPASQVDLERRQESGNASDRVLSTSDEYARRQAEKSDDEKDAGVRSFAVEGNDLDNYVGVDPIYQNYANESEAPLKAEDGPEQVLEEAVEEEEEKQKEYVKNIPDVSPGQATTSPGTNEEQPADDSSSDDSSSSDSSSSSSTTAKKAASSSS